MMTKLEVTKVLNCKDHFIINGCVYTLIMVDPDDATKYKCMCVDSTNGASIKSLDINAVPASFKQYEYKITNHQLFETGRVIYAYKRTTDEVKELEGIINRCNPLCISFMFRDTGGEHRTQMLTPLQIFRDELTIMLYDKPVIK